MIKYFTIPNSCPCCGHSTTIKGDFLICENPACLGKLINRLDHFCGKKGLDIKGLSKATLEKLIDWGWIANLTDIYYLSKYKDEWSQKPGFGKKSVLNILTAIENSKHPTLQAFISSLGIPLIGKSMSKELVKFVSSYPEFRQLIADQFDFSELDGFAGSKTEALLNFDYTQADALYELVQPLQVLNEISDIAKDNLQGYTIVITGKLNNFKNRSQLQSIIEEKGGKVVNSVSKNTNFLINNDNQSLSAKNTAAKKLNIPILTEKEFTDRFL